MRYWLGPKLGAGTADDPFVPPSQSIGHIYCGPRGESVFFCTADGVNLGAEYRRFGQGDIRALELAAGDRSEFATLMGVADLDGSTLVDWLFSALTVYADPDGLAAAKPIMPTTRGQLELWLAGHSLIKSKRFDLAGPEAPAVIGVVQRDYEQVRADALANRKGGGRGQPDRDFHRRYLQALGEQYRVPNPEDYFIPARLPRETPLPHSTTITDNFNRSDDTNISTGAPFSWTEVSGGWAIVSNQLRCATAAANNRTCRADSDLSTSNNYGQIVTVTNPVGNYGVACRFSGSAETCYLFIWRSSNTRFETFSVSAGSYTFIANGAGTRATNDTLKVQADGSSISGYRNGTLHTGPTTNTAIASGTRGGVMSNDSVTMDFDNFEAGDLATATPKGIFNKPLAGPFQRVVGP